MSKIDRHIFKYFNGNKDVFADPVVIERRWDKAIETVDIDSILKRFAGPDFLRDIDDGGICRDPEGRPLDPQPEPAAIDYALKDRDAAQEELVPVLYKVFGSHPVDEDGEGMTEWEVINAFSDFQEYRFGVKKNTETELKSPSSTDSPPS